MKKNFSRWGVLALLVVPMFASYFFDDMFSAVSQIFKNPEMLELGWDSADYGFYAGGYSFLCVWGGLIFCGMLLDKWGVRITGSIFVGMMATGAAMVTAAISAGLAPKVSLTIAYIGCMLFGLGSEIAGVAVTRSIAKWFKDGPMALAMGLQLAIARLGTAAALLISPMLIAEHTDGTIYELSETNRPALVGLALLMLGCVLWAAFVAADAKFDRGNADGAACAEGQSGEKAEDEFRFSDIFRILGNKRFLMIALLCVFFYCCIISFKKFATSILIPRFDIPSETAGVMDTFFHCRVRPAVRTAGRQVRERPTVDDFRSGSGLHRTSDDRLCSRKNEYRRDDGGYELLGICSHRHTRDRLLAAPGRHVAFGSEDCSGEEPRHSLLTDLLDSEHRADDRSCRGRSDIQTL